MKNISDMSDLEYFQHNLLRGLEESMLVGEAVDDAVSKLREVGIVIEGGHAHLTHAILRSTITKAIGQVRRAEAERNCDLENNEKAE